MGLYLSFINCIIHTLSSTGLFSTVMRDLANISNDSPKWIVLDGDIDPMWIESLNTVMDDNKVCANDHINIIQSYNPRFEP